MLHPQAAATRIQAATIYCTAGIIPAAQTGMKLFFSCFKNVPPPVKVDLCFGPLLGSLAILERTRHPPLAYWAAPCAREERWSRSDRPVGVAGGVGGGACLCSCQSLGVDTRRIQVAVNDHDYESLLPEGMCVITAPGPSKWHLLVLEPLRIVLLYIAAYLLYKGGYGGIEEIKVEITLTDPAALYILTHVRTHVRTATAHARRLCTCSTYYTYPAGHANDDTILYYTILYYTIRDQGARGGAHGRR